MVMDFIRTPLAIKRLIYLLLVIGTAFAIQYDACQQQAVWIIWTSILLTFQTRGFVLKERLIHTLVTGFMAAILVFFAGIFQRWMPVLLAYLFIVMGLGAYVAQRYSRYRYQAFVIGFLFILSTTMPISYPELGSRLAFMTLGTFIVVIYQFVYFPNFLRNEIHALTIIALRSLINLNANVFACLLAPEYIDNIYIYEKRLHDAKGRSLEALNGLRGGIACLKQSDPLRSYYNSIVNRLTDLFDNIVDYSQLRRRVSDYSTLSICSTELAAINLEITRLIKGAMAYFTKQTFYPDAKGLIEKIKRLENNYYNVLQVASREPLVFLFFIDSLNAFAEQLEALHSIHWSEMGGKA